MKPAPTTSTRACRRDRRTIIARFGPTTYFLVLALFVFHPVLGRGYVLTLDAIASPHMSYVEYLLRSKDPLYYGRLPVAVAFDALRLVVPGWVLQNLVLVTIVAGSGLSMYRACRDTIAAAALFAGTLYAINPFVYVRLFAGHWWLLLGYAALPLAVVSFADALAGRGRTLRAAAWATAACALYPHVAVLLAVAYAGVGGAFLVSAPRPRETVVRAGSVGVLTAGLSAYWLVPAVVAIARGASKLGELASLDLVAFTARGTVGGNVPLSVAMLFGFWRSGYRLPLDWLPRGVLLVPFGVVLLFAIAGWYGERDDPFVTGVAAVGCVGFVLGLGVSVDATAPLFRALYEHGVVFRGMRDSQKFAALLAMAYALLGARGVERLTRWFDTGRLGNDAGGPANASGYLGGWGPVSRSRGVPIRGLLVVAVLLLPLAYTSPMLVGLDGQLSATDYPAGWHEANDHLAGDPAPGRVLFLPWHQYIAFPWAGGTIANPADAFFERPVIRSRSIGLAGIQSQASSPAHTRVETVLDDPGAPPPFGASLAPVGVKYVVVAKVADHREYDYLRSEPDLVVVIENDDLVVYENAAFDEAPPPDRWPRAWPAIPWTALAVGVTVSLATLGWCVRAASGLPRVERS